MYFLKIIKRHARYFDDINYCSGLKMPIKLLRITGKRSNQVFWGLASSFW